jgi:Uma2 family endonuclease
MDLEEFLKLLETKPTSEYINGKIIPKLMAKGKYSRLQLKLCNSVNDVTKSEKIAYAFPELRCSFGIRSIVPDIAVFNWSRIPFATDGEVPNDFPLFPDWTIEIFSPEQKRGPKIYKRVCLCLSIVLTLGKSQGKNQG